MQNVFKSSNRAMLRTKTNYSNYLYRCRVKNNETLQQCLNQDQFSRSFRSLSHNTLRQIQKEYKAVRSLILRSGISKNYAVPQINQYRYLRTSTRNSQEQNSKQDPDSKQDPNKKNNQEKMKALLLKLTVWSILTYSSFMWVVYLLYSKDMSGPMEPRFIAWNEFVHQMLAKGEVKQLIVRPDLDIVTIILHDGAVVKGKRSTYKVYHMTVPDVKNIEEKVREAEQNLGINPGMGIPVIYERSNSMSYVHLGIISLLAIVLLVFMSRSNISAMSGNIFSQMTRAKFTLVDPLTGVGKGVRFSDVAGLQEAKTEVMELVDYLKNPDHYQTLGAKVPKGALLLGPPGCGKTLLAKAVATEANVPFLSMNGSEFIEMLGGLGAARVRDLFKEGKKRAPSIIYIDEIDAIGEKRSQSGNSNSEREQTLNQLLTEMDGMLSNQEVIVLASTNRAEVLDKALLRRGRFDRHILIDLPTLIERKQIFEQYLKEISLEHKPTNYSSRLAVLTPGFSGADIANVCNESALHAARLKKQVVTGDDLLYAIDRMVAGTEKRENTISPLEKRMIAYHESGHALIGWLLEHTDALLKVTIVPRTNRVLGFAQYTGLEKKLHTKEQLFEFMCMLMGGRVAESLTFNKIATGAKDDLEKVTNIAYKIVQQCGMDEVVGPLSFSVEATDTSTKKPYSKKLANIIDQEVRKITTQAYQKAEKILRENQDKLNILAEELLKKESLTYEEVEKLIGPPPFGKKHLIDRADFDIPNASPTASPPPP